MLWSNVPPAARPSCSGFQITCGLFVHYAQRTPCRCSGRRTQYALQRRVNAMSPATAVGGMTQTAQSAVRTRRGARKGRETAYSAVVRMLLDRAAHSVMPYQAAGRPGDARFSGRPSRVAIASPWSRTSRTSRSRPKGGGGAARPGAWGSSVLPASRCTATCPLSASGGLRRRRLSVRGRIRRVRRRACSRPLHRARRRSSRG